MKISYHWLKDIIDLNLSPEEIADLLTGCGLEVEGIEKFESLKGGLNGIVIGEVKTCTKHPNADKLSLTTVDVGATELLSIVCGAPNVAAGQKVLVATVGAMMYPTSGEPFEIKKSKIRGEVSEGMLCAEDELGLGSSHAGIMVLPADYVIGKKASEYISVYADYLLEIGLTANRGDAASHLGVARDLKALTHASLKKNKASVNLTGKTLPPFPVEIKDAAGCKRYSGIEISGITVKESPDWIKNRLKVIGIGSINNIVDATNYVLHELGQPLHAFDADRIVGNKIIVQQAKADAKFTTLDKVERKLNGSECMICDTDKPLAIAGVFGGLESGITAETKRIFIESAYFDASSIRKTAKYHGLSTDASFRYERGTDPNITIEALERVVSIIIEIAGGEISSGLVDVYPQVISPATISFSIDKLNALIGQEIPVDEIRNILTALEIEIKEENPRQWQLSVPLYRSDVKRPADIAEEILRIYGLNKIEIPSQLKSTITRSGDEDAFLLRNKLADFLSNNGLFELTCNSLTKSAYYTEDELKHAVKMLNPLSSDLDIMRMNMMFNGLEMIQYNLNRRNSDIKAFEYGLTYQTKEGGGFIETSHFSLFMTGKKQPESWQQAQQDITYYTMKSLLGQFLLRAGIKKSTYALQEDSDKLFNRTEINVKGKVLAEFGYIKSTLLKAFDIPQAVLYADINWNTLVEVSGLQKFVLENIPAFPSVRRDLALVLDKSVKYADIERIAFKAEQQLLKEVNAFDVYEGDKIENGKKSYAISFIIQDENKTLTDKEIDSVMSKLQKQFEKELGAQLRS